MTRLIPFFGLFLAAILATHADSSPVELSRYGTILDRKPFGSETPPTPAVGGGAAAVAIIEPFVKFLKISAFVRDDFSPIVRVGLIDTRNNQNQSYLLAEGESADGITLICAEFDSERILVSKDNVSYWLTVDGTYTLQAEEDALAASRKSSASTPDEEDSVASDREETEEPPAPIAPLPLPTERRGGPSIPSPKGVPVAITTPPGSVPVRRTLTERRRMIEDIRKRRAELVENQRTPPEETEAELPVASLPSAAKPAPSTGGIPPLLEGSEMERQLQEYQIQAIREGREPLPIPLSPEVDALLVNEGLLPPVD